MKLFKKSKSKFYWFDFTIRGQRRRGSTGETKAVRATKVASMKLAQALEHGDPFPTKPTVLADFSQRFLSWLDEARVEEKTRKYYRNGCEQKPADVPRLLGLGGFQSCRHDMLHSSDRITGKPQLTSPLPTKPGAVSPHSRLSLTREWRRP